MRSDPAVGAQENRRGLHGWRRIVDVHPAEGDALAWFWLFAVAVRRWPRERFLTIAYQFFMLNLLAFMALLAWAKSNQQVWGGWAFFIWVLVSNVFVVSAFWSFIVDVFDADQGKRLFVMLAAGATVGSIAGSSLTGGSSPPSCCSRLLSSRPVACRGSATRSAGWSRATTRMGRSAEAC